MPQDETVESVTKIIADVLLTSNEKESVEIKTKVAINGIMEGNVDQLRTIEPDIFDLINEALCTKEAQATGEYPDNVDTPECKKILNWYLN